VIDRLLAFVTYRRLLEILVPALALGPALKDYPVLDRLGMTATVLCIVGLALRAGVGRLTNTVIWLLACAYIGSDALADAGGIPYRFEYVIAVGFLAISTGTIIWAVWKESEVDVDTILGGVAVYLLIGVMWAAMYAAVEGPVTGLAAGLASMQAVVGQLYIAVLVARVVAIHTSKRA